jgi:fatty-acyl-CoA synthase
MYCDLLPLFTAGELHYALTKVGVKCLIMAPALKTSDYISMINDLCPELSTHSVTDSG